MSAALSKPPILSSFTQLNRNFKPLSSRILLPLFPNVHNLRKFKSFSRVPAPFHLGRLHSFSFPLILTNRASSDDFIQVIEEKERILDSKASPNKFFFWVLFWASVSIGIYAVSGDANAAAAAVDSIRASGFGVKVASALRGLGWPDEAVVFALATLPVIELRGAIPVGYWLQLNPTLLTVLSVLGNMVPVPFIVLYLKRFATFIAGKNRSASNLFKMLFENAKEKAGPVEEFQWLGLMLFVAVPFPGTGAWTGAIVASILDMPFWSAVSANFVGVVFAGLLVNLIVNLGLKYAIATGIVLFIVSTFMWTILRNVKKSFKNSGS